MRGWSCSIAAVISLLATSGCGASSRATPTAPRAAVAQEDAVSAADLARAIIDGRTGGLFELRAFRFHPTSAEAIGELGNWGEAVKKLGFDPLMDVARVFVVAGHAQDSSAIVVIEPEVDDDAIAVALVKRGAKIGPDVPYPQARIPIRGHGDHVAALVQPRMLVIAPAHYASELPRMRVRAKLPPPSGRAAAQFFAFDPADSLGYNPRWPETITSAHAEIEFTSRGGAVVRFFADSITDAQAQKDAKSLTEEAHRLLTVDLAIFELHLLDPPVFEAQGRRIFMQSGLLPTDVDWLLRFNGGLGT
ncbi:MAG: hypothetical protein HOW73_16175 [Polyangiaceae bacterium]|nr:hypothetical protein [Polyangiaceae bacterium]